MVKIDAANNTPQILLNKGVQLRNQLISEYLGGKRYYASKEFDNTVYGAHEVKKALVILQKGKCCFCEAFFQHVAYGDVEHFRPKAGWVQDVEAINTPGYFWLAYSWENLFLSCEICNQRHKKNFFPLLNPHARASSHLDDIDIEEPFFINPRLDEPSLYISFKEEVPVGIDALGRGKKTIEKLGLAREVLNEDRRSTLSTIKRLYSIIQGVVNKNDSIYERTVNVLEEYKKEANDPKTEYSLMIKIFFQNNPIQ